MYNSPSRSWPFKNQTSVVKEVKSFRFFYIDWIQYCCFVFAVNRIISFSGHSKLGSSDKYSTYFQPNFAMKVGNYLYPSFYVSFYLWKHRNRIIYLF